MVSCVVDGSTRQTRVLHHHLQHHPTRKYNEYKQYKEHQVQELLVIFCDFHISWMPVLCDPACSDHRIEGSFNGSKCSLLLLVRLCYYFMGFM